MTVLDIITKAFNLSNIYQSGQTIPPDEENDAFNTLKSVVAMLNNEQFSLYCITPETFNIIANQNSYTIGPSGNFNTTRPVRIETAYVRLPGAVPVPVDYPLTQMTYREYEETILKTYGIPYPTKFWYNPTYPLGIFYLYPSPSQNLELHITRWMQFTTFTSITETVQLPPGYDLALVYMLIKYHMSIQYGMDEGKVSRIVAEGERILNNLKTVNNNPEVLNIDPRLLRNTGVLGFNIYRGF